MLGFQVRTPICNIVPVSRAYRYRGGTYLGVEKFSLRNLRAIFSSSLMGSFGKGSLQKIFRDLREFPANFPQNFRTLY